ncbi:hypothetical protein KM043_011868 [Ampulex compressa]|nr:hypothetical protein KM043_011868 [Ampulex compressa]
MLAVVEILPFDKGDPLMLDSTSQPRYLLVQDKSFPESTSGDRPPRHPNLIEEALYAFDGLIESPLDWPDPQCESRPWLKIKLPRPEKPFQSPPPPLSPRESSDLSRHLGQL